MIEDIKVVQKYKQHDKQEAFLYSGWEVLVKYSNSDEWVPVKLEDKFIKHEEESND
jgi:hypothetical protein